MGAFVPDGYVPNVQEQINRRFIGEALTEMVGFQKEFKLFSRENPYHSLQSSLTLLGIAPVEEKDRAGFYKFVNSLKKVGARVNDQPSDKNGHDQIIASLQDNLESKQPKPVRFNYHPAGGKKAEVLVTFGAAFSFSSGTFLIISVPTMAAGKSKAGARKK
jgi:hypothetical protein